MYLRRLQQRFILILCRRLLVKNYGLHSKKLLTLPQHLLFLRRKLSSFLTIFLSSQYDTSKPNFFLTLFCSLPFDLHHFFTSLMPLVYLALGCTYSAQHYESMMSTWLQNKICSLACVPTETLLRWPFTIFVIETSILINTYSVLGNPSYFAPIAGLYPTFCMDYSSTWNRASMKNAFC